MIKVKNKNARQINMQDWVQKRTNCSAHITGLKKVSERRLCIHFQSLKCNNNNNLYISWMKVTMIYIHFLKHIWKDLIILQYAWYLYQKVTQNMLRAHKGKYIFSEKKIRVVTTLDRIKCLKQIKSERLLPTCASISELP